MVGGAPISVVSLVIGRLLPGTRKAAVSQFGQDTLGVRRTLAVGGKRYDYFSLQAAAEAAESSRCLIARANRMFSSGSRRG